MDYLLNDSHCVLSWLITSKSILITESASSNLKVTSISKPCNGFLTICNFLDGVCAFNLMDLNMEEEF